MSKYLKTAAAAAVLSLLAACGGEGGIAVTEPQHLTNNADFGVSIEGWVSGSSDYSASDAPTDVKFEQRALASPLSGKGYYIAGHNRSDDMFLFIKRQYHGLAKNGTYQVTFSLKFASSVPSNCVGVGGSPGESVYVYAAATTAEPKAVDKDGRMTMNFDKGNQGTAGKEAQILGTIGNGLACETKTLTSKTVKSDKPLTVKADANGDLWVLIGIDSGFESQSELTLQTLSIDALPLPN
jgi:hypothetical protein